MTTPTSPPRIGTAGWGLSRTVQPSFPGDGSQLERYAGVFNCTEINSTFSRTHRSETFERWAAQTPPDFRFSVKLPKALTHTARLVVPSKEVRAFVSSLAGLGERLAVLLVQLPPSLPFDARVARRFFRAMRAGYTGAIVCEPRHASWFTDDARSVLVDARIGRVAANPHKPGGADEPGGWLGEHGDGSGAVVYYRWHGSPRMYWSAYGDDWLAARARDVLNWPKTAQVWCIFDNTAAGAAADDALRLRKWLNLR